MVEIVSVRIPPDGSSEDPGPVLANLLQHFSDIETGREIERAAVVAWLRDKADGFRDAAKRQGRRVGPLAAGYSSAADAIESELHCQGAI